MRGLRDQAWFDLEVTEWIDLQGFEMADFDETAMNVIKEVMEHSDSNKAVPISDPTMMPDPMGNG